ncbi:MAG: hypothetical protein KKA31_02950 [Candidatus Margulisbacteria bacterium]|nr:hypothetical protein [Candidatus Margulisiibacteriota bacterium]
MFIKSIALILFISILTVSVCQADSLVITRESWSKDITLKGEKDNPVVLSPIPKLTLSGQTSKVVVLPEELTMKDEIAEFRLFRNRYVIFGVYLFTSLYYNWLTRHR